MIFKILGGDLVQRARRHLRGGNAQFFGFGENFLALDSKLLRYVVNTNGHINLFRDGWTTTSSWAHATEIFVSRHIAQPSYPIGDHRATTGLPALADVERAAGRFCLGSFH